MTAHHVTVDRLDLCNVLDALNPDLHPADPGLAKRTLARAIARLSAQLDGLDICPACAMPIEQGQPKALEGARGALHASCAREVSTDGALR